MTSKEKADQLVQFADEMKAERIETLYIRDKTPVADYFVVCSANSDVHMKAIADRVEEKMRTLGVRPLRRDESGGGWVLHDYGDVVFHVMREEKRQFYDLETLWATIQADPNLVD